MTDPTVERAEPPGNVEPLLTPNVLLWRHTSIRVGGPARFWAVPADVNELRAALRWAQNRRLPCIVLGGGSNVVFPDSGYDGLVIRTAGLHGRFAEGTCVRVAAGERLADVAWWATRLGLSGLEWACGIPGSVGGAVVMNAGTRTGDTSGVLDSVEMLAEDGSTGRLLARSLQLGYRTSALLRDELSGAVIEAVFALHRDDPETCAERARRSITERLHRFPVGASAGCVFRNPATGATAGELLDRAGCKGMKIGRARVSRRHANVVVNEGVNNASDVLELIDRMKARAFDAFGVELREEIVRFDLAP